MDNEEEELSASLFEPLPEIRYPPGQAADTPVAHADEPASTPIWDESEIQRGNKTQKRGQQKSLDERVEELLHNKISQFMLDTGQDEAVVRSVLMKRRQDGLDEFRTPDDMLMAIDREVELQKRTAAPNDESHETKQLKTESEQSAFEPLRGCMELPRNSQGRGYPEHRRYHYGGQGSDTARQLFGQFKLKLAEQLTLEHCLRLSTSLGLPWACREMLENDRSPAIHLLDMLESRGIITMDDVTPLEMVLHDLHLRRAAREVTEYQSVANRMENRAVLSTEEGSSYDDFKPDPVFVDVLDQLSEYLSRWDIVHLCTYFSLSPREVDKITANKNPGSAMMMLLYKKGTIGPNDVLFLTIALREVNLNSAASKLDSLMHSIHSEGPMQIY